MKKTQDIVNELNALIQDQFTRNEIARKLQELTSLKIEIQFGDGRKQS